MGRRPKFAVDWDGTCVENKWPHMGDWLPGAVDALRTLSAWSDLCIYTCRIADCEPDEITRRPVALVQFEKDAIRTMLDAEGLHTVRIHDHPWKPPADAYIDDKGIHYNGRPGAWSALVSRLHVQFNPKAMVD